MAPTSDPSDPLRSEPSPGASQNPLLLPRLLFLHGGGTNGSIFFAQTRALRKHLCPYFRLVYATAPHICHSPGPDIERVCEHAHYYKHLDHEHIGNPPSSNSLLEGGSPWRTWLRGKDEQSAVGGDTAVEEIDAALEWAMSRDDKEGGRGDWVGLVGFSQGAKVVASLLLREQMLTVAGERGQRWKFAVLMAGRGPLIQMTKGGSVLGLAGANQPRCVADEGFIDEWRRRRGLLLSLPTLHVHGLGDEGLQEHRRLMEEWCDERSTRMVEWMGGHRIPIKKHDVTTVVEQVLELAHEARVLR